MTEPTAPHGLADPSTFARLSGRELLQAIADGRLPQAPIGLPMRFRLVSVGEGEAAFEGEPDASLLNPLGTVHGGWALTLIDSACGCAAHSLLPAGTGYTTVETQANFVRPIAATAGRVRCEAAVLAAGRQIMTAQARVIGADGKLLAHGKSTLMVLAPRG